MGAERVGPRGEDPSEGEAPPPERPGDARPWGTKPWGTKPWGTKPWGTKPWGTKPWGTKPWGTKPWGTKEEATGDPLDPDVWSADIAELFCAYSAVVRLGARLVIDDDEVPVPRVDAAPNGPRYGPLDPRGVPHPGAAVRRGELHPREHALSWRVNVPDRLARSLVRHPDAVDALKEDVARALAVRADEAFLRGPAGGPGPAGIRHIVNVEDGRHAGAPLEVVRHVVGLPRGGQALFGSAGWVVHPMLLDQLAGLEADQLLVHDGRDGGVLLGYPFVASRAATGDAPNAKGIFFSSDWGEAWVGATPGLVTVDISTDAHFDREETVVRAVLHHDLRLRRPESFVFSEVP